MHRAPRTPDAAESRCSCRRRHARGRRTPAALREAAAPVPGNAGGRACSSPPRGCRPSWPCPGPDGGPGPRLGAQLPEPGAGGGRAGPGEPLRAVAAQPVGEFVSPTGVDTDGPGAGRRARRRRARTRSPTTRPLELLACYGIEMHRVPAGRGRRRGAWPRPRSSATRWRSRPSGTAGGTAPTWSGSGWTWSPRPGSAGAHAELSRADRQATVYVQRMAPRACPACSRCVDDPSFGSLLSFGLSGMATELLGDRAYRAVPVSDQDAAALVRAPRAAPLLTGYRGTEPVRRRRWRTWCCGSAGWPRTCPRCAR